MHYCVPGNRFDHKIICSLAEYVHIIRCNKTLNVVINGDIPLFFNSSCNAIITNEEDHVDITI